MRIAVGELRPELAIPITGRPSNIWSLKPSVFILER
jgi:hypothetical protein